MTSQLDPPTHNGSGFFSWLRGLGVTRSQDRWLAGVAGGLAARAGIDPLIVRGVFLVLGIVGGPALLIYVAGWLLLPNASGRIHVEDIVRGRADSGVITMAVIAGAVIVLPVIFFGIAPSGIGPGLFFGFGGWDLWGALGLPEWLITTMAWLFWISVVVAGSFWVRHLLIKRGRAQQARPATPSDSGNNTAPIDHTEPAEPAGPAASAPSPDWVQNVTDQANRLGEKAQHFGEKAEQWGQETGERVDAWSARYAQEHEARKLGAGHVLITLAFALLAAGFAAFATLQSGLEFTALGASVATFSAPLVAAIIAALSVLAVSLIVAGMRGRNTGVIGFLSFCGVVALLITAVLPWGTRFQPFGDLQLDGHSVGSVSIAGNVGINLRDLDDSPRQPTDLVVWHGAGELHVAMPEDAPVVVDVRMLAGEIIDSLPAVRADRVSGPFIGQTITANLPPGIPASAAKKTASHVTVYMLAGKATVTTQPATTDQQSFTFKEVTR
ncbi:PspC domain-containing protein [Leucobacter salsicius]|uniref:PspC domain-containing protein n=1 Tax=Leucobacter salsicius TaxID=664638 RepID=UPI00034B6573|nr:PspC domain-containing protein [Leucobacter salsicius]